MAPAAAEGSSAPIQCTKDNLPVLKFTAITLAERPDLKQAVVDLCERLTSSRPGLNSEFGWPNFLYKGVGGLNFFDVIFGFPQYQTLVIATHGPDGGGAAGGGGGGGGSESLAAVGYAAPCVWDGKTVESLPPGWDDVILTAKAMLTEPGTAPRPTAMSALAVEVSKEHQGRGLSRLVLGHMKQIAVRQSARGLLAPIRPILKPQYPLVDMADYIAWRLPDPKNPGQEMMFDPWLRTHLRLGARVLRVARASAVVRGSVAEWEAWTGLRFLSTGPYTLPGGLVPLSVDVGGDVGEYREDNVWVAHDIRGHGAAQAAVEAEEKQAAAAGTAAHDVGVAGVVGTEKTEGKGEKVATAVVVVAAAGEAEAEAETVVVGQA